MPGIGVLPDVNLFFILQAQVSNCIFRCVTHLYRLFFAQLCKECTRVRRNNVQYLFKARLIKNILSAVL